MKKKNKPWILVYDIETAPLLSYTWGLWDQNISLNQIKSDFHILSWSAKWMESADKKTVYGPHRKIMYMDQRNSRNIENDKKCLKGIWDLLNQADIVLTQNGKSFDEKKLNARFLLNGMKPPSPVKHIDTLRIAKSRFALTSNKLEYMTKKLCRKQKSSHKQFPGFELWLECMKGNLKAWDEMKKYNPQDVLSLEELYVEHLQAWDTTAPSFNLYTNEEDPVICNCGSDKLQRRGFSFTTTSKYQRYQCQDCGHWSRGKKNMLTKNKKSLLKGKA